MTGLKDEGLKRKGTDTGGNFKVYMKSLL